MTLTFAGVTVLCMASAIIGRLLLTRDQAVRTITVRLPALALLIVSIFVCTAASLIFALLCFIGGSFYGLGQWWWPTVDPLVENIQFPLNAIISGRRQQ